MESVMEPFTQGDNASNPKEDTSFHQHVSSLAAGLIFGGAISLTFFALSYKERLVWTPWLVFILGFLAIVVIYKGRLVTFEKEIAVLFIYLVALVCSAFLEIRPVIHLHSSGFKKPPPVSSEVALEDLDATFSGFRKEDTGGQSFVVLTISNIVRDGSRTSFRYSINVGLSRVVDQGLIYSVTSTLQLRDGTIFKYEREGEKVILWSINHSSYRLSRVSNEK
jgi:hypothetical protein